MFTPGKTAGMGDLLSNYVDAVTYELLVSHFGGQELHIPGKHQGKTWERLVEALGVDRAGSLVRWFEGEKLYIPTRTGESRKDSIKRLHLAGKTATEISKLAFVSKVPVRSIYRILKESA